jgi:RND family efflux transporter MFP subunit
LIAWATACGLPAMAASTKPAGCLIEPEQVADVGSPVTGVIEDMQAALGDQVTAGQPLVRLRADVERANAGVALVRAQVDAEVKAAQANWDLAKQKVRRNQQLLEQSFVSTQAVEQATAEAEVAEQKLKLAQSQQKIYAREEAVALAQVGLRTLRSPITGVVVERYSNLGERVEDKPVMRIAAIDPLRVSLMVPIAQYGQVAVGNSLLIRPEMPGIEPVRATVTYVDKVVDAASNSFRVRLTLPNPGNRLPGGLRCKADLVAQAAPAPSPAAAKVRAAVLAPTVSPATTPVATAAMPSAVKKTSPATALVKPVQTTAQALSPPHAPAHAIEPKPATPAVKPAPLVPMPAPTAVAAMPVLPRVSPGMSASMQVQPQAVHARLAPAPLTGSPVALKNTMALTGLKAPAVTAPEPAPMATEQVAAVQPTATRKHRRKAPVVKPPAEHPTDFPASDFDDGESSPPLNSTLTLIIER